MANRCKSLKRATQGSFDLNRTIQYYTGAYRGYKGVQGFLTGGCKQQKKDLYLQPQMQSTLNTIIQECWQCTTLEEAQCRVQSHLNAVEMRAKDRKVMLRTVAACTTKAALDRYLANALLKYEGLGL